MKKGLSSNCLKIIAIIIMVIDHIGRYFYQEFDQNTYYILRSIGRIAMPIFAYLIVQGFFYTKNVKKYIFRIFSLATIAQVGLLMLGFINQEYYPDYWTGVNNYLGVLYSYFLSLILLTIIDRKIIIKRLNEKQNLFIRINIFILIVLIYLNFQIEFDMVVPFMILELYAIEKIFEKDNKLLLKQTEKITNKKRILYLFLILICLIVSTLFIGYSSGCKYVMIISIIFIALYNGENGQKNKIIQYLFYLIFPLQHIVLYLLAMVK